MDINNKVLVAYEKIFNTNEHKITQTKLVCHPSIFLIIS